MATMSDKQFDEMLNAERELRELLTQSLVKAPAAKQRASNTRS
jgi:hypothetical protein